MKYGIIFLVLVLSTSGLLLQDSMSVNDWMCFKGSPERIGSSDAPAPDTLYLQWKLDIDTDLWASPVVKDKKIYQVTLEKLYCIDLNSGNVLWVSDVPVYQSTPFLTDDKIIVATNRGISALSIETGDVMWEYIVSGRFREILPLRDYIVSSPVVSKGNVVVGTMAYSYYAPDPITLGWPDEMHVICLDEATGKEEWYVETRLGVLTSPCVNHEKVFAASREMMCIDLKKGDILWNSGHKYPYDVEKPVKERYAFLNSTPALYHGILIGGSSTLQWSFAEQHYIQWQKIVFMDQYTGDILGEWVEKGILASSPGFYQGKIYIYSYDGILRCISLLKGEKLWETSISKPRKMEFEGSHLWPSPTVADSKVYIGSIEGIFYCLDADTGEILWEYKTEGEIRSAPAVVPGKILVSSTNGTLYCFGVDPATYKMKAQQYIEEKMYDKAKEFLIMAKEYAEPNQEIEQINQLLDLVEKELPEYEKRLDTQAEAESFMDEADKILWSKKFRKAKTLYTQACEIYTELENEFGVAFCEKRIDYIEKRIAEQSWMEMYWWLLIVLICLAASMFFVKRFTRKEHS